MKKKMFCCFLLLFGFSFSIIGKDNKKVITFWHLDARSGQKAVWQKIADDFMKLHSNIEIKLTVYDHETYKMRINTVMQSKNPPDLFRSWGGSMMNQWAEAGLLRDITAEVKNWPTKIGKGAIGVYSYKGKTYGMPYDMGAVGFWYNKDLFKKVGQKKPPETWREFIALVKKLKAAKIIPIALGAGDKWPSHFYWVYLAMRVGGKQSFDSFYFNNGSIKDKAFIKAGQMLKELKDLNAFQKGFLTANYGNQCALMGDGEAAMELMGQWAPDAQKGNSKNRKGLGDKLGFFPFPAVEGGKGKITDTMGGGNGYLVGKNAPDEAIEFLKFITSVKINSRLAQSGSSVWVIPTVAGAEKVLTNPHRKAVQQVVASAGYFQLYYDQYLPPATSSVLRDRVYDILSGRKTPQEAAKSIASSFKREMEID